MEGIYTNEGIEQFQDAKLTTGVAIVRRLLVLRIVILVPILS